MKIITITNRKGGVGKTTIATHVAAGMATMGYNVGIVDTDSQGNVALMFGIEPANDLFDVLIGKSPLAEKVVIVPPELYSTPDKPSEGNLYMLRSYDKTFKIPIEMPPTEMFAFYEMLLQFGEVAQLDYMIVDSQPSLSQFDGAIYLATDAFLYVTECEMMSINGLTDAIEQMQRFNATRKKFLGFETKIIGIVPNKMRTNTAVNQQNVGVLGKTYGVFDKGGLVMSPLRLLTVWQQASNDRIPIYVYAPSGEAASDAWRIVNSVVERVKSWETTPAE